MDRLGRPEGGYNASQVRQAGLEPIWDGDAPEPRVWQLVVELHEADKNDDAKGRGPSSWLRSATSC